MFWISAAVLAVAVAGALLLVLRRRVADAASRRDYDVNVYKDQLKELEREAADGRIAERELAAARIEIERRLLAAGAQAADAAPKPASRFPLIATAVAVPLCAALFYALLGTPGMPDFPLAERTDRNQSTADSGQAMMSLIQTLEGRLAQDPSDPRGWVLLGRSYATLGDNEKAAAALAKALPLTDRNPEILADWAELSLMKGDGMFTEEIFNAFAEARKKDPSLPKPWFYIGLDRAQGGKFQEAAQLWVDLIAISPPDASYVSAVREKIAQAAQEGGFDAAALQPSEAARLVASEMAKPDVAPAQRPAAGAMPGPTQEDVKAAGEMSAEDRNAFIRSMVDRLASRLKENPNDPAGWERLINAYQVLGETAKADAARERLKALTGR